jgi:Protein of unknown function (DUF3486)
MGKKKDRAPTSNGAIPNRFPFPDGLSISHKIEQLPKDLKNELDRRLAEGTFRSFRVLSTWLGRNGYRISHQSLSEYGRKFDRRLDAIRLATEQARIVCAQFKDDDVDMQTALLRMVQTRLFEVLRTINQTEKRGTSGSDHERVATVNLTVLARTVSNLARAETENRKWAEHAREALAAATKKLDDSKGKGLSPEVANQIRAVLMEI